MTDVIEIEAHVHTVVVEQPSSESSVLIEEISGAVVVDGEVLVDGGGAVEVADGPVEAVEIVEGSEVQVVEVEGARGLDGAPGPQGPAGENPDEIPDMTLIFENGLI